MNGLFVFGLGYSATAVAMELLEMGWRVSGTVRARGNASAAEAAGIVPIVFSDKQAVESALSLTTHLLISVPPGEAGDPSLSAYGEVLEASANLRWIGYLSTIGVYGDRQGAWVDEDTPPAPETARGLARIDAESAWTAFASKRGLPLDIFRLSGIYGPGRSPIDRVRQGDARRIVKAGQVFNRIHVEDIGQAIVAAMLEERHGSVRILNVTDDEPAAPQDVISYAAQLIGVSPPPEVPFDSANLSPMARSFYSDNKRVSNAKMKRELGIMLRYPTYREGLQALARSGNPRG
jgi:nucleoside-diphosphate-sugar epimerase